MRRFRTYLARDDGTFYKATDALPTQSYAVLYKMTYLCALNFLLDEDAD